MVTARATQYTGEDSRVCVFLLSFPSPVRGGGGGGVQDGHQVWIGQRDLPREMRSP